jgi:23S rRNA pseudouridine2605 synthase
LLMTNDGDVAHALLHPSHGNEREYRVNVKGLLDTKGIKSLERGVTLEEGRTASVRVEDVRHDPESGTSSLSLTLVEGKKRQIRRTLLVLGFPVRRLVRVRMGPLRLGRLAVGEARTLRSDERQALFEHVRRLRAGETPLAAATKSVPAGKRDVAAPPRPNAARRGRGPSDSSSRPGASKSSKPPIRGRKAGASRDGMGRSAPKKSARKKTARKKSSGRPSSSSSASSRSSSPSASRAPSRVTSPSASRAPSRVTSPSASRSSSRASSPSASRAPSRAPKKPVSRRPSSSGSSSPPRGPKRSTGTNSPSGPKGPRGSGPGGAGRQRTASSRKGVRR